MEEIIQLLWRASQSRKACRIIMKGEPLPRAVHPYGICRTSTNGIVLVCWQTLGFTKIGGKEGYRNLVLDKIEQVEILDTTFRVQNNFNPADTQYREWVYHI